jgi:Bacterial regulatory helix-turn-helix protein, lysR family
MDTIASMRAFVAVAKTGSFSAAAQKLDLVPSVITKRVTQLERIVGKTLFHRSTRQARFSFGAGIVDRDIQPAEAPNSLFDKVAHLVFVTCLLLWIGERRSAK